MAGLDKYNQPIELDGNKAVRWWLHHDNNSPAVSYCEDKGWKKMEAEPHKYHIMWEHHAGKVWHVEITRERYWELDEHFFPIVGG